MTAATTGTLPQCRSNGRFGEDYQMAEVEVDRLQRAGYGLCHACETLMLTGHAGLCLAQCERLRRGRDGRYSVCFKMERATRGRPKRLTTLGFRVIYVGIGCGGRMSSLLAWIASNDGCRYPAPSIRALSPNQRSRRNTSCFREQRRPVSRCSVVLARLPTNDRKTIKS